MRHSGDFGYFPLQNPKPGFPKIPLLKKASNLRISNFKSIDASHRALIDTLKGKVLGES